MLGSNRRRHRRVGDVSDVGHPRRARTSAHRLRSPGERGRVRRVRERSGGLLLRHAQRPLAVRDPAAGHGGVPGHRWRRPEHRGCARHGDGRRRSRRATECDRHRTGGRRALRRAGRPRVCAAGACKRVAVQQNSDRGAFPVQHPGGHGRSPASARKAARASRSVPTSSYRSTAKYRSTRPSGAGRGAPAASEENSSPSVGGHGVC